MSKPIKASEIMSVKNAAIPEVVIDVFNDFIIKNFNGRYANVVKDQVVEVLVQKGLDRQKIYANHWLDVEDLFRENGWNVQYDSPGYDESYPAFYVFKVK